MRERKKMSALSQAVRDRVADFNTRKAMQAWHGPLVDDYFDDILRRLDEAEPANVSGEVDRPDDKT